MSYTPTLLDAASDLRRCIYASMEVDGFKNTEFLTFWNNAKNIITKNDSQIRPEIKKYIHRCLSNVQTAKLSKKKRQEDILMAATLLQAYCS